MRLSSLTRTRKGRVLIALVPTVAALAFVGGGVAQGVVPVSMAVSGQQFKISADKLQGTGFSQYAGVAVEADKKTQHPAAIANITEAKLYNLCQSIKTPFGVSLLIEAGTNPQRPVEATGLQIGMDNLAGDATFNAIRIGVDASTVTTAGKGDAKDFAMDSDTVTIDNLKQVSWSTQAAVFKLTDLKLGINMEGKECF
ncbi:hypothetical protein Xcel_0461 [Xylanimonas cellulosilytica DSM 15894]|uniref:Cholesterol esterase n=1 Tax=Xylanimonas cellulosilytica (strain DSM 15894 / JCM 12276 / CECT 5975 / KCTC 9989 / LMG 20990 / NBRC 107835 / XIL07) TaxID=446471 RepID=D1BVZ7_XYLCX|nr:DUF6230 family protein [Xylanimonas cellulosilytica]ACZ29500.1 hypothetical protein Xcel_0461 [Xylanimonas cellulosilytica DSM 15894]